MRIKLLLLVVLVSTVVFAAVGLGTAQGTTATSGSSRVHTYKLSVDFSNAACLGTCDPKLLEIHDNKHKFYCFPFVRNGCPTMKYAAGTVITLKARVVGPFQFLRWGDDCSGTSNECVLVMDADKFLTDYWSET